MALVTYILLSAVTAGIGLSNSSKTFHPSILSQAFSRALAVLILDFCFVKLGCYILNVQSPSTSASYSPSYSNNTNSNTNYPLANPNPNYPNPNYAINANADTANAANANANTVDNLAAGATDLVAYGGYKFVGVILTLTANFLSLGRTMYALVFLYAFLANAFFLLRSLRSVVLPDTSHGAGAAPSFGASANDAGIVSRVASRWCFFPQLTLRTDDPQPCSTT